VINFSVPLVAWFDVAEVHHELSGLASSLLACHTHESQAGGFWGNLFGHSCNLWTSELKFYWRYLEYARLNLMHSSYWAPMELSMQVSGELQRTKRWAQSHVADNCCFHYRRVSFWLLLFTCQFILTGK
jgi:hypothetical protein